MTERESVKEMAYKLLEVISEYLETMEYHEDSAESHRDGLRGLVFDFDRMGTQERNEFSLWIIGNDERRSERFRRLKELSAIITRASNRLSILVRDYKEEEEDV